MNDVRAQALRRVAAWSMTTAVVAVSVMGCGYADEPSPTTSESTTSSATVTPTEKAIDPTGANKFTPSVQAPPAPNVPGGQHPGINGVP